MKASKDAAHHAGKRVKTVSFGTVIWRTLEYVCQVSESFGTRASDGSKQEMCQPALHRSHNRIYIFCACPIPISRSHSGAYTFIYLA